MSMEPAAKLEMIRSRLVPWFRRVARDLPWRRTRDPYRIWLSEIMLQQTRVGQAETYYNHFIERYPSLDDLASAELDVVLRDWEGLGYYARARNMHRSAQMIVREMGGEFPRTHEDLLSLPGVGPYTAAAVLSIALGQPLAVVDGNVIRVLSRLFGIEDDPATAAGKKSFQALADDLLDRTDPGAFNEAMMELGATVCTPRSPGCERCPVASACVAYASGRVEDLPFRRRRRPVPHNEIAVAIIFDSKDRVFIQRRAENGLLGGLWEFPGGKIEDAESARQACRREVLEELGVDVSVGEPLEPVDHAYSHFTVTLHAFRCRLRSDVPRTRLRSHWVDIDDLAEYAFPRANRRLIEELVESRNDSPGRPSASGVHL